MLQKLLIGAQFVFFFFKILLTTQLNKVYWYPPINTVPVGCYTFEGHVTKPKLACLFCSNNNDMDTDANHNNKNI